MSKSDPLAVTPVTANYPVVVTVCLSLFGTTVLTWCLGTRHPQPNRFFVMRRLIVTAVRTKSIESWRNLSYPRWRISPTRPPGKPLTWVSAQSSCSYTSILIFLSRPQPSFKWASVSLITFPLASNAPSVAIESLTVQSGDLYVHSLLLLVQGLALLRPP